MAGSVRCTRCSKTLPTGGAFCRRCGWPTTHAVAVPGGGPPALTPPGFFPPVPREETPSAPPSWRVLASAGEGANSRPVLVSAAVAIVLIGVIVAGITGMRSYRTRQAQAAAPLSARPDEDGRGTWRVVQGPQGQTVHDYLFPNVKQVGGRATGVSLTGKALEAITAVGKPSSRGYECIVTNKSAWSVREVCVEVRTWQDPHTTRTEYFRVPCQVRANATGAVDLALPLDVPPDQRTEVKVVAALGEVPFSRPSRRR
jgi:hypothetical protein